MKALVLSLVAAVAPLFSSCSSTAGPAGPAGSPGAEMSRPEPAVKYSKSRKATAASPFTGPQLPSAKFVPPDRTYAFGGSYSRTKPESLLTTHDPGNPFRFARFCGHRYYKYSHAGHYHSGYSSYCAPSSCSYGSGYCYR